MQGPVHQNENGGSRSAAPCAVVVRDVAAGELEEQEQAAKERQLRHAHRMESIGRLAAGIAHEISTPTQFVGDNLRFLKDSFAELAPLLKFAPGQARHAETQSLVADDRTGEASDLAYLLEEIPKAIAQSLEGVARISRIVLAMKEFSHPGGDERTPVDLNRALEMTLTVSRSEWKRVADLTMDLDSDLRPVLGLPGELNQVMLNLVVNAAHAIADVVEDGAKGKGRITVTTRQLEGCVEVWIADTGAGIPETIRGRVFESFFTTKGIGKGTGQGLALAHDVVVDKHGGTIRFETEPGRGTTFVIRLPLAAQSPDPR